ncbi:MAG: tyrosine-type recombinase/integrase [Halomonas sp.]|uniref:tyrosine-type recombinase/integrase n=1 Tax=Halomonas sp. TaxID=1486246 RepID=UPI002ACDFE21|nr:tyrosine-type recombinase/integrase [Halomonas sp.]MDZ7853491.1 tyrosine-type recombinase/integrase [Halomonas sp.]
MARGKPTENRSLRQRGNVWFIQKRLSPTLAKHLDKKILQQSTQTGDLDEACRIRDRVLADLGDLEAQLKGEASQAQQRRMFLQAREQLRETAEAIESHDPRDPVSLTDIMDPEKLPEIDQDAFRSVNQGDTPDRYRLTLRAALEDWKASPLVERKSSTISKNTLAVERLLTYLGEDDVTLVSLNRQQLKGFITSMLGEGKTKQTVANYLSGLSAIWHHAEYSMEEELPNGNPFKGHQLKPKATVRSYDQFTRQDVEAIFKATAENEGIYHLLPRLGFYTGARLDELCSLKVTDIIQRQGIWCLAVREGKNQNATREVPLHSEIKPLVMDQLEHAKAVGSGYLFPEAEASTRSDGKKGPKFSQWFARLSKKVIKRGDRKLGFHSFRTTAITIMGDTGVGESVIVWITGHERGLTTANKVYNRGPTFKTRLEAVETIRLDVLH